MTSKEALKELQEYTMVIYDDDGNEIECYKFEEYEPNLFEPIEKDLEVLEIIKTHSKIKNGKLIVEGVFCDEYFSKIKEWLENA